LNAKKLRYEIRGLNFCPQAFGRGYYEAKEAATFDINGDD
jgi:hypothetical protein